MGMNRFEIISHDYYSNCLIEALKAKFKDWKNVKITYVSPFYNEVFCPHFLWTDGEYDYDFGNEGRGDLGIQNWALHKGHIRRRELGYNEKYRNTCKKWATRHKRKGGCTNYNKGRLNKGVTTMPNELKPCPFCGRAPETRVTVRDKCIEITISCSCGVKKVAEICADPYTDLTAIESGVYEVTEDWNRRADNG